MIYVYRKKYQSNKIIKIGSTQSFLERMNVYKTSESDIDNDTIEIWKFDIIESIYNCYMLDEIIQHMSNNMNIPYKHYNGSGGIEHYYYDDIENLVKFFDTIDVKFKYQKMDVDKLREETKKIRQKDSEKICEKENKKRINI